MSSPSRLAAFGIWLYAFGYFASYVPYSALTKALSKGLVPGMEHGVSGFVLLPSTTLASLVGMVIFLAATGWWRHAGRLQIGGLSIPAPSFWTFLSGICTATIIATTTLAYTFEGASIVFMMLLMRGGVLILAPIVDLLTGRRVQWFSMTALALSLLALVVAFAVEGEAGTQLTIVAAVDVLAYLGAYFLRLRFMSRLAKSGDRAVTLRYFVEEQLVATPAIVLALVIWAFAGHGFMAADLREGFTSFFGTAELPWAILVGVCSQGTGIAGGLILLDARENTYCVPVNRCSSILAGVVAAYTLVLFAGEKGPGTPELVGAALILAAIGALTIPPLLATRAVNVAARAAAPIAPRSPPP
jgi:hypothetical protein